MKISKNNCEEHITQVIIDAAQCEDISNHELELAFYPEGTHVLHKKICCFPINEREEQDNEKFF